MVEIDHQDNRVLFIVGSHRNNHAGKGKWSLLESFGEKMQGSRTISTGSEPQCPHGLRRKEKEIAGCRSHRGNSIRLSISHVLMAGGVSPAWDRPWFIISFVQSTSTKYTMHSLTSVTSYDFPSSPTNSSRRRRSYGQWLSKNNNKSISKDN